MAKKCAKVFLFVLFLISVGVLLFNLTSSLANALEGGDGSRVYDNEKDCFHPGDDCQV